MKNPRYYEAKPGATIKFVYFDVGNVMLSLRGGFKKLAAYMGAPADKLAAHWTAHDDDMARGKLLMQDYWVKLKTDLQYTGPDMTLMDYMVGLHSPIVETHALAQKLSATMPIGLLTNIATDMLAHERAHGGIPDLSFAATIESCVVGAIKPEKEIFRLAHLAAKVEPHEILFIDDLPINVEQAIQYGMNTYLFDTDNAVRSVEEITNILP